jgi:peptidoglycan/LPS O-acetylase OafA/YrhL
LFTLCLVVIGLCAAEPKWSTLDDPLLFTAISATYGIGIAALVASIACCRNGAVMALLQTRWLAGLGRISYGFYLYHNLIPDLTRNRHVEALFGGTMPMWAHALGIVASFAISLGIALLSWRFIEEPILRVKARGKPELEATENVASDVA